MTSTGRTTGGVLCALVAVGIGFGHVATGDDPHRDAVRTCEDLSGRHAWAYLGADFSQSVVEPDHGNAVVIGSDPYGYEIDCVLRPVGDEFELVRFTRS